MKFLQYLGRSFADTLLLLLGVTGVTFSLMSAYTVPADETQCFLYCLLFSALFSFLFHIRAHGRPVCIAVLLLFALCIFLYRERLYNAVLAFLSVLTDTVRENTNLNLYVDAGTSSRIVLLHRLDEFFCFLPALLACVFGLFWVRLRSFLLCLLIAVPLMGLCVVLIDAAPETAPVLLFAIFCVVCVCTGYLRRSQSQRQALATLVLLPLAAGFVLLVSVLFPSEDYVRSPFGDRLFSFFEQLVTLRYDPEISMDPGSESSGPEVSGPHTAAPMQQPLPLTGVDSPRFTGRNVLSLTTEDFTGPLLLRGYSLVDYTGSAWEPADDVQSNFPPNTIQTYTGSALRYLPDSVLHTMTVRPMYAADRKSIVYTPYFYAGVEASDPTFSGDSALYATGSYLFDVWRSLVPDLELALVPGISAHQLAASRAGKFIAMAEEVLSIIPCTGDGEKIKKALAAADSAALYKPSALGESLRETVEACGPWRRMIRVDHAGLADEKIIEGSAALDAAGEYLSVLLLWR